MDHPRERVRVERAIRCRGADHHAGEPGAADGRDVGEAGIEIGRVEDEVAAPGPDHRVARDRRGRSGGDQSRSRGQPAYRQARAEFQPVGPRRGRNADARDRLHADFQAAVHSRRLSGHAQLVSLCRDSSQPARTF